MYEKVLGFDLDAQWLYHSSAVFLDLGGEPVLNYEREVVGMNVMADPGKSNMHFAISVKHLRDFVAKAGKEVKAWFTLLPPRERPKETGESRGKNDQAKSRTDNRHDESSDGDETSDRRGFRIWINSTGKFRVLAKYVAREGDMIKLEEPDGTTIEVAFSKLSDADQRFLEKMTKNNKESDGHN
jgi:hypothetical protein